MLFVSLAALWNNSCRAFHRDLFFGDFVCIRYVRFRARYIQLFGNYAAVYVCNVLFYADSDVDGLFTPVSSMPEWAQVITYFNPLKYFMEGMRMVYLKGSSLLELLPEIGVLLLFALGFNTWAVISYRKNQ